MEKKLKFAVVLSGCGVFDGSEIHESTLTLYFLSKKNIEYEIFAPDILQTEVVNHITGGITDEKRNVLIESARIARGKISGLDNFKPENFDAIIFPGGFGIAKNLSDFAQNGSNCKVNNEIMKSIKGMFEIHKPICAFCIAPVILAGTLNHIRVTIGKDEGVARNIAKMGSIHENASNTEIVVDSINKIVTSPCYMLDSSISQIGDGIEKAINAVIRLIED
jgi:enhancing lycopene biosynthesis protein 2